MLQSLLYVILKAVQKDCIVLQDHDPVSVRAVSHLPREIMVAEGARAALVHCKGGVQGPGQLSGTFSPGMVPYDCVLNPHPDTPPDSDPQERPTRSRPGLWPGVRIPLPQLRSEEERRVGKEW